MYKILIAFFTLVLLSTGCTKDPSNVSKTDAFNSNAYPKTMDELTSVLAATYANIRQPDMYGFLFRSQDIDCIDHTANLIYDGDPSWNEIAADNLQPSNGRTRAAWTTCFRGIQQANAFFDRATFYLANYALEGQEADVNTMRGEAHFMRALYYFDLECLFGESYMHADGSGGDKLGLPLLNTVAQTLDSTQLPRSTVKETWDFIVAELQQSAALLKGKVWVGDNRGRATEWSAKALLGKAYVFMEDWADAKTTLQDVITNSGKSLMPFAKYRDAFIGIDANEFNEESIFEINVDRNSLGGYGIFEKQFNTTTSEGLPLGPSILGNDGTEDHAVAMGYCNEFFHDANLKRLGFNLPVWTLVNNPAFDPAQPESPSNPKKIIDPAYKQASLDIRSNKTADPRLFVNALQPWVDSGSNDGKTWRPIARCINWPSALSNTNYYGWSFRKYNTFDNDINNYHQADGANVYVLRLADVYLLYAEATLQSGDNITALEYINKVKRRAYDYPVDAPSAVDYHSLTDNTSAGSDPDLGTNPLYYERWAELMGEGHWWFDVCRWRIGKSEASVYQSTVAGVIKWDDTKSYVWPIPFDELSANTKMRQSEGY